MCALFLGSCHSHRGESSRRNREKRRQRQAASAHTPYSVDRQTRPNKIKSNSVFGSLHAVHLSATLLLILTAAASNIFSVFHHTFSHLHLDWLKKRQTDYTQNPNILKRNEKQKVTKISARRQRADTVAQYIYIYIFQIRLANRFILNDDVFCVVNFARVFACSSVGFNFISNFA